jgi:hypothetical protein
MLLMRVSKTPGSRHRHAWEIRSAGSLHARALSQAQPGLLLTGIRIEQIRDERVTLLQEHSGVLFEVYLHQQSLYLGRGQDWICSDERLRLRLLLPLQLRFAIWRGGWCLEAQRGWLRLRWGGDEVVHTLEQLVNPSSPVRSPAAVEVNEISGAQVLQIRGRLPDELADPLLVLRHDDRL